MFQRPPATPAELEAAAPLALSPAEVAELSEEEWYRRAYRGDDARQLTARAVLMGSLLGFLLAFTNLYVGLKTGWHLGVAITACILSFTLWTFLQRIGVAKTPMTILENNCMQSTASAAGYSTGATMVSAIPALLVLSATPENPGGTHLPVPVLTAWTILLALLGVSLAIPMKRNLINQERLKFPSGLAAASTLQGLYASGAEATRKGRILLWSALAGAIFPLLLDLNLRRTEAGRAPLIDGHRKWFDFLPARGTVPAEAGRAAEPSDWTLVWDLNPVMVAAGALVGLRTTLSMVGAALALAYVLGPYGMEQPWVNLLGKTVTATTTPGRAWREIGLWFGAPMMVSAGLLSFAAQWRTIVRAFQGFAGGGGAGAHADVEVPTSWFGIGAGIAGFGVVLLAWQSFGVPPHFGALAVVLTFALALVAARATGETDITPTGAMGKIMQLTYGVLIPQNATANLMTAGITSGSASACADLLNDLKSGYLLGANPRRQFLAQAAGIVSGTIATVTGFYLLVPDATAITGTDTQPAAFPAPAAQAWRAVAEMFQVGIGNLHPVHQQAIYAGLITGAVLTGLELALPKYKKWLPSPTGIGLGFIMPAYTAISMAAGAIAAAIWTKADPKSADGYIVPVASGLIAGISILGVLVAALNNLVL